MRTKKVDAQSMHSLQYVNTNLSFEGVEHNARYKKAQLSLDQRGIQREHHRAVYLDGFDPIFKNIVHL